MYKDRDLDTTRCGFSFKLKLYCTLMLKLLQDNSQMTEHVRFDFNSFTDEVAIMRLLGSAPMSHLCDQKRRSKVTGSCLT
jgi:hypothetical protein